MKLASCLHAVVRRLLPLAQRLRTSPGHFFDACWEFSRRYFFTVALFALLSAKLLHLYAHIYSLPPAKFLLWGITFFFQDVCVLILIRICTQRLPWRPVAIASALVVIPFSLVMSGMAAANASFYVVTGAEIHWRQAKTFHRDAAAIRTLLTGLTGFLIVEGILLVVAWFTANQVHRGAGGVLKVLAWPFRRLGALIRNLVYRVRGRQPPLPLPDPQVYEQIAVDDYRDDKSDDEESLPMMDSPTPTRSPKQKKDSVLKRVGVLVPFTVLMVLRALRPWDPAFWFLSGALPFTPFTDGSHRPSPVDTYGMPGDYRWLEGRSSLSEPPVWDWMPEKGYPGFEDWDQTDRPEFHYNPKDDPLHISNLNNPVLEPIRKALEGEKGAKIKHVFLLKLESTRGDLFPIRKDSFMWDRIAESYKDKTLPQEVKNRIANLTRTAEFLTGFSTGFQHNDTLHGGKKTYGGVAASNAFTTGTYTLKSVTGTVCGITPLVADFNREFQYHIYQPCLPHIFNALTQQADITNKTDDFRTWPWHSKWMQSVTDSYDHQDELTPVLGYHDVLTKERIEDPKAKHYPPKGKEVNYYGYADTELREYIRDAIDEAERNHTRLFLTHLTGTTHHPWGLPDDEFDEIISSSWTGSNGDLNRYLNTIHYVDGWLQEILDILQEKGIADETLLVMMGDHGLSLPNDGGATPYDNPHIGSFHIPIVFSHPKLPQVEIKTPVISQQIVPTILDLLIESSSLGPNGTHAAKDIRSLYEGQSMIRQLIPQDKKDKKKQDWQFTVMNTGGSWLAVRSAAQPKFRLVIPLIDDLEWRFTDLEKDPNEKKPYKDFSLVDLAEKLDKEYGEEVVDWLRDAAHVTQWWVVDNWHRYRYQGKPKHMS